MRLILFKINILSKNRANIPTKNNNYCFDFKYKYVLKVKLQPHENYCDCCFQFDCNNLTKVHPF